MNRNVLVVIALSITVLIGAGYGAFGGHVPTAYPAITGPLVGLAWVAVGMFGRDDCSRRSLPQVQDVVRR